MKVGIISDSHGNDPRLRAALALLAGRGVKTIVHCGDISSTKSVDVLGSAEAAVYLVAGNMDKHVERLEAAARDCNIHFAWEAVMVPIGGEHFLAATHGHDEQVLGELILSQQFPYVCHGHTHRARDERIGSIRVINPGALHRTSRPTLAILDTDRDHLDILDVPESVRLKPRKDAPAVSGLEGRNL